MVIATLPGVWTVHSAVADTVHIDFEGVAPVYGAADPYFQSLGLRLSDERATVNRFNSFGDPYTTSITHPVSRNLDTRKPRAEWPEPDPLTIEFINPLSGNAWSVDGFGVTAFDGGSDLDVLSLTARDPGGSIIGTTKTGPSSFATPGEVLELDAVNIRTVTFEISNTTAPLFYDDLKFKTPVPVVYLDFESGISASIEPTYNSDGSIKDLIFRPKNRPDADDAAVCCVGRSLIADVIPNAPAQIAELVTEIFAKSKFPIKIVTERPEFEPYVTVEFGRQIPVPPNSLHTYGSAYDVTLRNSNVGNDRFDERKDGRVAIFVDPPATGRLDTIAEIVAHEIGHSYGLAHVDPPTDGNVLDYEFGDDASEVSFPSEVVSLRNLKGNFNTTGTHNPTYHLRRWVLGEDDEALRAEGLRPGSWDKRNSLIFNTFIEWVPDAYGPAAFVEKYEADGFFGQGQPFRVLYDVSDDISEGGLSMLISDQFPVSIFGSTDGKETDVFFGLDDGYFVFDGFTIDELISGQIFAFRSDSISGTFNKIGPVSARIIGAGDSFSAALASFDVSVPSTPPSPVPLPSSILMLITSGVLFALLGSFKWSSPLRTDRSSRLWSAP